MRTGFARPGLVVALAVLAGCSGSAPAADPAAPSAAPSAASSDRPTTADLEALYWTRQQEAAERYTEADVAFMTGMIGHHAQALRLLRPRTA